MDNRAVRTVAIVGNGIAGWMSAALLSHMLGPSVSLTLVDIGNVPDPDTTIATIPPIKALHQSLGFDELDLIAKCQGSMKLGTQFVNWGKLGDRYFHPHGSYGAEFDAVPLHQWWLKAKLTDASAPELDDLSMAWALARDSRFTHPAPDRRLVQSTYDYAYHLDATLYAEYLKAFAISRGVHLETASLKHVARDSASGFVTHLDLEGGKTIDADLVLDCSGSDAIVSQGSLNVGFLDGSDNLPCDRVISLSCAKGGDFTPYTKAIARDAGWQWRIPLQHRTGMGYVFKSDLITDDNALSGLMDNLDGPLIGDPTIRSIKNGRSAQPFSHNVIAIGDAAGYLEPLEATNIHMIQSSLTRLLALWPTRDCNAFVAAEYNRVTALEWDLARDLLALHYKANSRTDAALWRATRDMPVSPALEARLQHWKSFGRLISPQPELFQSASWLAVLVGQGIWPENWDPLVEARMDRVPYLSNLQGLARVISETAAQMQLHKDWIDKQARGPRV